MKSCMHRTAKSALHMRTPALVKHFEIYRISPLTALLFSVAPLVARETSASIEQRPEPGRFTAYVHTHDSRQGDGTGGAS